MRKRSWKASVRLTSSKGYWALKASTSRRVSAARGWVQTVAVTPSAFLARMLRVPASA